MARHPSILFLFLGGSTLDDKHRRGSTVIKPSDVDDWLSLMGEMEVIASIAGVFIHDGLTAVGMTEWASVADHIYQQYNRYDGFVIVHQTATLPEAAVALSLMMNRLGKPVVLVGSPLLSPVEVKSGWSSVAIPQVSRLGAKANFINALQVAVSDIGEVVVTLGHRLYRGRTFSGPLADPSAELIGKIDFGVRFFSQLKRRQTGPIKIKPEFASRVAIIEFLPGLDASYLARLAAGSQGVFISVPTGLSVSASMVTALSQALKKLPILLNAKTTGHVPPNVVLENGDRNTLLVRFMWALGQTRDPKLLRKMISS